MARKIEYGSIKCDIPEFLFRGYTQNIIEFDIMSSFLRDNKSVYRGHAFEYTNGEKEPLTFVTRFLSDAFIYALYNMKKKCTKKGGDYRFSSYNVFTIYPAVMAIDANPYRDRLFFPDDGEGIYIKGGIDTKDIVVVFGLGINRIAQFLSESHRRHVETAHKSLLEEMEMYELSEKSFVERLKDDSIDMNKLMPLFFGLKTVSFEKRSSNIQLIKNGIEVLEQFYKRDSFESI